MVEFETSSSKSEVSKSNSLKITFFSSVFNPDANQTLLYLPLFSIGWIDTGGHCDYWHQSEQQRGKQSSCPRLDLRSSGGLERQTDLISKILYNMESGFGGMQN